VSGKELLKRSLIRFLKTGRYYKSTSILDSLRSVEQLLPSAGAAKTTHSFLAKQAGYNMDENGFVEKEKNSNSMSALLLGMKAKKTNVGGAATSKMSGMWSVWTNDGEVGPLVAAAHVHKHHHRHHHLPTGGNRSPEGTPLNKIQEEKDTGGNDANDDKDKNKSVRKSKKEASIIEESRNSPVLEKQKSQKFVRIKEFPDAQQVMSGTDSEAVFGITESEAVQAPNTGAFCFFCT
jgi:hypothetical protein